MGFAPCVHGGTTWGFTIGLLYFHAAQPGILNIFSRGFCLSILAKARYCEKNMLQTRRQESWYSGVLAIDDVPRELHYVGIIQVPCMHIWRSSRVSLLAGYHKWTREVLLVIEKILCLLYFMLEGNLTIDGVFVFNVVNYKLISLTFDRVAISP